MNIFIIPSWYPSKENPVNGIFFHEQAKAIGRQTDHKVIISLWGQSECALPINKPLVALTNLIDFPHKKPYLREISQNTYEIFHPSLSWYHKLLNGNMGQVIAANEKNLKEAQDKFGSIDLIHAHVSYPGGFIAMHLAQKFNIPYVITEHMSPFPFKYFLRSGKLDQIIREPLEKADQIIAVSPSLKGDIEKFGIKNIEVIPNLIDEKFFYPIENSDNRFFTFFSLGNLGYQKGTKDLILAISLAVQKNSKIRFRIGGSGNRKPYVKMVRDLALEKYVNWLGPLDRDKARIEYQKCDAFILPSRHESFGVVFVEAMACGKPVITTRCGGPESIVTKQTGILTDVGDITQIARAMNELAENPNQFDSKVIRQEFLDKFSEKVVVNKIESIYKKVVKKCAESPESTI